MANKISDRTEASYSRGVLYFATLDHERCTEYLHGRGKSEGVDGGDWLSESGERIMGTLRYLLRGDLWGLSQRIQKRNEKTKEGTMAGEPGDQSNSPSTSAIGGQKGKKKRQKEKECR